MKTATDTITDLQNELVELSIDILEQFGSRSQTARPFIWAGGRSTLENALDILWRYGITRYYDRLRISDIKNYYKHKTITVIKIKSGKTRLI